MLETALARTPMTYFYTPEAGHGLPHDPMKAIVAPRPIGWISTISASGHVNLAPYSFFNMVSDVPQMLMFSSGGRKDSLRNIEETGEFVANLAVFPLAEAMNRTSAPVSPDTDEFVLAGLDAAPSTMVRPPRVAAAPAAIECRCIQIIPLHDLAGKPGSNTMVIGQVVGVHIDPAFLVDGRFDTAAARPLARCGYNGDYAEVSSLFRMYRPKG
jgi:flavin reductase (DIM6/NTAB) family NADH-FMN oxidoreductase RutF